MILAGIDEAGYGPTLGPLVVAGTVFRVPDEEGPAPPDLWKMLGRSTCRRPDGRRVPVDDSKKLYSTAKGIGGLEEGVLAFLERQEGGIPGEFRRLLRRLADAPEADRYLDDYPWYRGRDIPIPAGSWANQIRNAATRLAEDLAGAGVEFLGVRAVPMEVLEFNRALDRTGNKSRVSFGAVGSLLDWVWRSYPEERIEAWVDRQGGRMRYGPILFARLKPRGIRIGEETEETSSYQLSRRGPPMRVTFTVDCDGACFPVALASMCCKYIRELHMSIFNRFWGEQVENLRPTAGYYVDAKRFLEDIGPARERLAVGDEALIRKR
jgi:hypothetical protein